MKMKFLCLFCVVLYFQSGDCLYTVPTGTSALNQSGRNEQFNDQRNVGTPPSIKYNLHNNPPGINQVRKPIEQPVTVRTINEPNLRQSDGYGEQERFIKTISEANNETPNRENNIIRRQGVASEHFSQLDKTLNSEILKEPSRSYEVPRISTVRKENQSNKPDEGLQLELQGISPEYIKSIINKQIPLTRQRQDPFLKQQAYRNAGVGDGKDLSARYDDKTYPTATFQNPSAESVYKFNQALPYEINSQQFLNKPQGNTYLNKVLINTRRLQDIYKSEPPKKRYTIIHPDGRMEQVDDVNSIIRQYPNYVMIRSEDVRKYVQDESKAFPKVQVPPLQRNPSAIQKANNRENYSLPETKIGTLAVNNKLPFIQNTIPLKKGANFEKVVNNTNDIEVTDNQPKVLNKTISEPEFNSVSEIKPTEISFTSTETTIGDNDQQQKSADLNIANSEYQNVTESNVLLNSPSAVEPINDTNNIAEIVIDTTLTPFLNESIILNDVQNPVNVNDTLNLQVPEKEEEENSGLDSSVSSTPLPNVENTTENSAFWFQADEQFWDKLINRNNTQNLIYFLFIPPKPSTEKETKTTVYSNGTTVEEVIETINGDDGLPKIKKSITVTHKNDTTPYPDAI